MPQHYGFRFSDDLAEKLNSYADRHKLSRSEALMQLLISALENAPVTPVELVQQTEQIQEIVEIKTAYLAIAINEVKHTLEGEIESLKAKLEGLETRLGES